MGVLLRLTGVAQYTLITEPPLAAYSKSVSQLRKRFRHIEEDLSRMYRDVCSDPEMRCQATAIRGFGRSVWKYRCRSRDQKRGQSGGFRVLCYIEDNAIYPLVVWAKVERSGQPADAEIKALVESLTEMLE